MRCFVCFPLNTFCGCDSFAEPSLPRRCHRHGAGGACRVSANGEGAGKGFAHVCRGIQQSDYVRAELCDWAGEGHSPHGMESEV
jgi:hypothetical protein